MSQSATRTKRFLQNTLATAAYQIVAMIMGFLTPRVMIAVYGDSINGVIGTVNDNILYYFKYVHVGIAAAAMAALYKPLAEADRKRTSGIISATRSLYNTAGWLFSAITVVVALIYATVVHVTDINGNPSDYWTVFLLILVMGISPALEFFAFARNRVLIMADQRTYVVSLAQMISLILQTAVLMILPRLRINVIIVRLIASLTVLARVLVLDIYTRKNYPEIDFHAKPDKTALSGRWDALLSEMTVVFQSSAGAILGTFIVRDATTMSIYIVYHLVTTGLWSILKMVTEGVNSIFGNLRVSDSEEHFQLAYRDFECLYHSVCAILFGVASVLIVPFAELYTRGQTELNYAVPLLGAAVIVEAVTNHAKMPFDLMIQSTGHFRDVRSHCLIEMGVTIVCSLIFGIWGLSVSPMLSLCGVMAGVSLGNVVRTCLQLHLVPKTITHLPARSSLFRMLRALLTMAVIILPCTLLHIYPLSFSNWLLFAVAISIWALIAAILLALLMDRKAFLSLIDRARYFIRHSLKKETKA